MDFLSLRVCLCVCVCVSVCLCAWWKVHFHPSRGPEEVNIIKLQVRKFDCQVKKVSYKASLTHLFTALINRQTSSQMEAMSSVASGWGSASHSFTLEVFKRPWGHKTKPPREPTNAEYWHHRLTIMGHSFRGCCSYKQRKRGRKKNKQKENTAFKFNLV